MKKLFLLVAGVTLGFAALNAGNIFEVKGSFDKKIDYKDSGVGFEIYNKAPFPIWVVVKNGLDRSSVLEVPGGENASRFKTDIAKPTIFGIWLQNPGEVSIGVTSATFRPTPDLGYIFTKNKTIYVTYDGKGEKPLRPETGPKLGLLGKTESNLSLKHNVVDTDIKKIPKFKVVPVKTDFYKLLEIPRTASADEIKKAYRKLALKYHPDKNASLEATEIFKQLAEANETLSDTAKKAEYDERLAQSNL